MHSMSLAKGRCVYSASLMSVTRILRRQTAVTAHMRSKQLLLFALAWQTRVLPLREPQ